MDDAMQYFLGHDRLQDLLDELIRTGYQCVGPQVRDGAIVYDTLTEANQLPWGVRVHQSPGKYHLETLETNKAFSWANGPQAIKPILFKPSETVWRVVRNHEGKLDFQSQPADEQPVAILGARACDLAAMHIQDKVFIADKQVDPRYAQRRKDLFVIAVQCGYASENCFCVSAGTGPNVQENYDLCMTEINNGFVLNSSSEKGENILRALKLTKGTKKQCEEAVKEVEQATEMQQKRIPLDNKRQLRDLLFSNLGHPRWDDVAERCLSCGNCTSVCPTCFCHSETEKPNIDGTGSEHQREWDSCFSEGHSYVAGKPLRDDTKKRYRQWLTHKVGSWFDQFDTSGCVGCGRCITWCPVGIDITEELAAISGESNIRNMEDE